VFEYIYVKTSFPNQSDEKIVDDTWFCNHARILSNSMFFIDIFLVTFLYLFNCFFIQITQTLLSLFSFVYGHLILLKLSCIIIKI